MTNKKSKQIFYSMLEVEKRYFPKSSQLLAGKRITDAKNLGTLIARSPLAKIKTLIID